MNKRVDRMPTKTFLTLERLTTFEQFCDLKDEWDSLAREQVRTVFLTHFWLKEWWKVFGADFQLWTLTARENGKLVGVLPLMLSRQKFGSRILKFMGAGEVTPNHLDLIALETQRNEVVQRLISYIYDTAATEWDVLELDKISDDSRNLAAIKSALETLGARTTIVASATCPYTKLPDTFDALLSTRSSKTLEGLRRNKRRIAKDFPEYSLRSVESPEEVQRAMSALIDLHQKRWTQKGYTGAFASRQFVDFHYAVAQQALSYGQLRLYFLQFTNDVVGVFYCFRVADVVQYYLGGFDETWSKYGPGTFVNLYAMEQAILEEASFFDFLEGDEAYKHQWMTAAHENFVLRVYRPNIRGSLYRFRLVAGHTLFEIGMRVLPLRIRRPLWQFYLKWSARSKASQTGALQG